jgi:hypothetical protein
VLLADRASAAALAASLFPNIHFFRSTLSVSCER